jgi:hypothetical protein
MVGPVMEFSTPAVTTNERATFYHVTHTVLPLRDEAPQLGQCDKSLGTSYIILIGMRLVARWGFHPIPLLVLNMLGSNDPCLLPTDYRSAQYLLPRLWKMP